VVEGKVKIKVFQLPKHTTFMIEISGTSKKCNYTQHSPDKKIPLPTYIDEEEEFKTILMFST
jgi:hypothetical protein